MSNSTLKILPALMIAIAAALVTQPMRAGVIDTLVITEKSSTLLTATLNGNPLTVTPNSSFADRWFIALAGVSGRRNHDAQQAWTEPAAAGFVNIVRTQMDANGLDVVSDIGPVGISALPDGTTDTTDFFLNGGPLYVTFNDKGDVATTPDTGTTASLFGLSLTGLAFLRRKLC